MGKDKYVSFFFIVGGQSMLLFVCIILVSIQAIVYGFRCYMPSFSLSFDMRVQFLCLHSLLFNMCGFMLELFPMRKYINPLNIEGIISFILQGSGCIVLYIFVAY